MTLEEIFKQIEELENTLEYYENRLEEIKTLVMPKATQFDKILVDGGKHADILLKYVEEEDKLKLEDTIKYIKGKLRDLETLKDKELDRLSKYNDCVQAVVCLREHEFKKVGRGKKARLTWDEIADRIYCSPKSARNWYKKGIEERKKIQ